MNIVILLIVQLLIAQIHPLPKVCVTSYYANSVPVYSCTTGETGASSAGAYALDTPVSMTWFKSHCVSKSPNTEPYGTVAVCDAYAQRLQP